VMSGEVRPLRGSFVLRLCKSGGLLRRRQDMPDEAFFDYDEQGNNPREKEWGA